MKRAHTVRGPIWAALLFLGIHPASAQNPAPSQQPTAAQILKLAIEAAGAIPAGTDRDALMSTIAPLKAESGDVAGAFEIARSITDEETRYHALDPILKAQLAAKAYDDAIRTVQLSIIGEKDVVEALVKDGQFARAVAYVNGPASRRLDQRGERAGLLATIAAGMVRAGDRQGAATVIAAAHKIADDCEFEEEKNKTIVAIVQWQAAGGDVQGAVVTARKIPDADERESATSVGVAEAARSGRFADAITLAQTISNPTVRSRGCLELVTEQAKAGDIAGALSSTALVTDPDIVSTVYSELAETQLKRGDKPGAAQSARMALDAFEKIEDLSTRLLQGPDVADVLLRTGQGEAALEMVARLTTVLKGTAPSKLFSDPLDGIATMRLKAGDIQGAIKAAKEIKEWNRSPTIWMDIVEAQIRRGDLVGAETTAAMATAKQERSSYYLDIARAYAQKGRKEAMARFVGLALAAEKGGGSRGSGMEPKLPYRESSPAVINLWVMAGEIDRAVALARKLPDGWEKSDTISSIAYSLAGRGSVAAALELLKEISRKFDRRSGALLDIAALQTVKAKDPGPALLWARRIASPEDRAYALTGIAWGLIRKQPPLRIEDITDEP